MALRSIVIAKDPMKETTTSVESTNTYKATSPIQPVASMPNKGKGGPLSWVVYTFVMAVSIYAWGISFSWDFSNLNVYLIFPLLGLLAWTTMWTHYFFGFLGKYTQLFKMSNFYKKVTAYKVLALILLHPGLLAFAQWQNGQSIPPASYFKYVGSAMVMSIIFAEIALITFLSFEVFNRLKARPLIQRNWRWVSMSQMLAMALIFMHSLSIGQNLQNGWFRYYWIGLGLLLIPSFIGIGKRTYTYFLYR